MLITIIITLFGLIMQNSNLIYDFDSKETSKNWYIVNDSVMGGLSSSKFEINKDGTATFSGTVSLDNNGGFASVRAQLENNATEQFEGVMIKVKGDGQKYNLRFRTNKNFDGMAYQEKFTTTRDEWKTVKIPFNEFQPTFRGRLIPNQPELKSEDIRQIGLLIADKQFGDFTLDIDWIKFY